MREDDRHGENGVGNSKILPSGGHLLIKSKCPVRTGFINRVRAGPPFCLLGGTPAGARAEGVPFQRFLVSVYVCVRSLSEKSARLVSNEQGAHRWWAVREGVCHGGARECAMGCGQATVTSMGKNQVP